MIEKWRHGANAFVVLALAGIAAIGVMACGSDDPEVVVQTVVVEREVQVEVPVVQTVEVERLVEGETVVQTVVVEREVLVEGETVVQTVEVEKEIGRASCRERV